MQYAPFDLLPVFEKNPRCSFANFSGRSMFPVLIASTPRKAIDDPRSSVLVEAR